MSNFPQPWGDENLGKVLLEKGMSVNVDFHFFDSEMQLAVILRP